jgi:hypothetical protein
MRKCCSLVENVVISRQVRTKVIVPDIPSQHKHLARGEDAISAGDTLQPPHLFTQTTDLIHGSSTGPTANHIIPQESKGKDPQAWIGTRPQAKTENDITRHIPRSCNLAGDATRPQGRPPSSCTIYPWITLFRTLMSCAPETFLFALQMTKCDAVVLFIIYRSWMAQSCIAQKAAALLFNTCPHSELNRTDVSCPYKKTRSRCSTIRAPG